MLQVCNQNASRLQIRLHEPILKAHPAVSMPPNLSVIVKAITVKAAGVTSVKFYRKA